MAETTDPNYKRIEYDDQPNRCQSVGALGQCRIIAIEGYKYCKAHGGGIMKAQEKEATRNFRLGIWQQRVNEFADSDKVKSLREEVGILRIMLEEIIRSCTNTNELLINSNRISDLVMKIDKVVKSCHQLELQTGMLLDKTAVIHIAQSLVGIVSRHVIDPNELEIISADFIQVIATTTAQLKEN